MTEDESYQKLKEEYADLKQEVEKLKEHRGGMLSSVDFRKYCIRNNIPRMKELFRARKWQELPEKRSFIIDPFDQLHLMSFSYDLAIGNEAFSFRTESRGSFPLGDDKDHAYWMEPGETVIVRTVEYIALPAYYSATVWPRFNFVREGIFQSMVKIDPTWYGQLGIALTNLSPAIYPIWQGKRFATLILYELREKTDITLYRSGEILADEDRISISLNGIQREVIERGIREKGLEGKCEVEDTNLCIAIAVDEDDFKNLRGLHDSDSWKERVDEAIRIKTSGALGLPNLDLILEKDPDGKRLDRKAVAEASCTQQDLVNAAVERGRPFHLLSAIPQIIRDNIEHEVTPRIRAEVEASIFPKIITLTLTVLGFLSLIIAVTAFVMDKYRVGSPLSGIDWPGTVAVGLSVLGIVLLLLLLKLLFQRSPESRAIQRLKKEVEELKRPSQRESEKPQP